MRGVGRPKLGTFCWPELATTDAAAAKRFYRDLFDWDHRETSAGPGTTYTIFTLAGRDAAALTPLAGSRGERGAPPRWDSYVAVASADASADRARALGGTLVTEPSDVGTSGRMAVVKDPQGAALSLWEAREHAGIGVEGEIGSLCWTELATTDVAAARNFYGGLFGWTFKKSASSSARGYTEIAAGRTFVGGILAIEKEWGPMAPSWGPYFRVADCDVTAGEAKALGGRVLAGPSDIPNLGRYAFLADPQGATFAVISFAAFA
jgi:predicted enzyme related to lactoylglutathione lyase